MKNGACAKREAKGSSNNHTHLIYIFQETLIPFLYLQHNSLRVALSCISPVLPAIMHIFKLNFNVTINKQPRG